MTADPKAWKGHTLGPWRTDGQWVQSADPPFHYVALAQCGIGTENRANAALIAAAPSLAAEVKRLREALIRGRDCLQHMADCAFAAGIEGSPDWDHLAGGADLYGALDAMNAALERSDD